MLDFSDYTYSNKVTKVMGAWANGPDSVWLTYLRIPPRMADTQTRRLDRAS